MSGFLDARDIRREFQIGDRTLPVLRGIDLSVGAIMATCKPFLQTFRVASVATTVFPDPTSPSSRRFMG